MMPRILHVPPPTHPLLGLCLSLFIRYWYNWPPIKDPQTVSQVSSGITVPLLPHLVLAFALNTFSEINSLVGLK